MKLGITTLGMALAGTALLAAVAWASQDAAASKPAAKPKPQVAKTQAKPGDKPQAGPGSKAQAAPASKPQAAPASKPQAAPANKAPAKPAPKPAAEPASEPAAPEGEATAELAPNFDAIMATRLSKASTPTASHEWLAALQGKWKMVMRHTILPDKPAVESSGTSEFKMLMDGRFLIESCDAAGGAGAYKGMGVLGFNTLTGKAERVWFDTTSTAMVKSEGDLSIDRNEIRWVDTWTDPLQNGVHTTTSVLSKQSDSEFTFQQMNEFHGQTFKTLVVQYRKE